MAEQMLAQSVVYAEVTLSAGVMLLRKQDVEEIGGPDSVRDAVEILRAERIGHGIAAAADPELMALLAERSIGLEICPTSNLRTGALARLLGRADAGLPDHPLPQLFRAGIPISLSTDDPAMFDTSLVREFGALEQMTLRKQEILSIAEGAFAGAFLPPTEKAAFRQAFRVKAAPLGLL
ncbi:MAG: hypothetical protein DMG32_11705 [Acidobacteria bacterium]|nr:MAG: hypothetical protein DMG32_11705 [Acidobacteriota bacterium]